MHSCVECGEKRKLYAITVFDPKTGREEEAYVCCKECESIVRRRRRIARKFLR